MGAGGVGGYFGARLARAGEEVHFIARGAHLAAIGSQVHQRSDDHVPAGATETVEEQSLHPATPSRDGRSVAAVPR